MSIIRSMYSKIPLVGNLVASEYAIVNRLVKGNTHVTRVKCKTARVTGDIDISGLVLTEAELMEACLRFIKYEPKLKMVGCGHDKNHVRAGQVVALTLDSLSVVKKPVNLYLVYLFSNSIRDKAGYMFTKSELDRAIERSKRIPQTVKRPDRWQRFLIWIGKLFNRLPEGE